MRCCALLLTLAMTSAASAAAQLPSWLRPGTRLRITTDAGSRPVTGELVRFDADSVTLQPGGSKPMRLSLRDLKSVEVSRERGNRAGSGALIGLIAGFSFGAIAVLSDENIGNQGLGVLVFGGVFGGLGAGAGGLIGAGIPKDRWEPITPGALELQPRVGVAPGRFTIGLSIRL